MSDLVENLEVSIDVKEYEGQLVVSSREVANNFEKQHRNVLRDVENIVKEGCSNLSRPLFIESKYQHPQNKQWYKEYLLTRDGFSLLVMGFTGAKALQWKLKYIEAFNKMERALRELNKPSYMIEDPIARAERWIKEQKEKQELQKQNELMQPKADYFDNLVERNLLLNFRDSAKELHIKERKFINWLLENKYVYRDNKNKLKPYSKYVESGLFEIKEFGNAKFAGIQTLITPKGRETFRLLYNN